MAKIIFSTVLFIIVVSAVHSRTRTFSFNIDKIPDIYFSRSDTTKISILEGEISDIFYSDTTAAVILSQNNNLIFVPSNTNIIPIDVSLVKETSDRISFSFIPLIELNSNFNSFSVYDINDFVDRKNY